MVKTKFGDAEWRRALLADAFGRTFWYLFAFACLMAVVCYWVLGVEEFVSALERDLEILADMLPRVMVALTLAGFVWVLMPRDRLSELVGRESGIKGLVIATVAGAITPGGPASAYPFLAVLGAAGADRGALIAYIASWATLGVQRFLVWDLPFMGPEFSLARFLASAPLPIIVGLIARSLPFELKLNQPPPGSEKRSGAKD